MPTDPTQDQDFLSASPQDQHAYLMHSDPDYAKASGDDQRAYLAHVRSVAPKPSAEAITKAYPEATSQLKQALSSGQAPFIPPTRFEQEKAPFIENFKREAHMEPQEYLGLPSSHMLGAAYEGAKGLLGSTLQGAYDVGLGEVNPETNEIEHGAGGLIGLNTKGEFAPIERARAIAHKYITGPAGEHIGRAEEALKRGDTLEAIGHGTAAALPLVGPWAAHLGERAGTGDISGAAGEAAGTILAGGAMAHPMKVGEGLKAVGGKALDVAGNPLSLGLEPHELLTKGVRPRARAQGWQEAIQSPGVQRAIQEHNAQVPITSVTDFRDAIPEIKEKLWDEKVQPALDRQGPRPVDMAPAAQGVRDAITPQMRKFDPRGAETMDELAKNLDGATTVEEASALQKYANQQLESYFAKYPTARRSAFAGNPDTLGWETARRGIRDQLTKTLEDAGETETADARKDYGRLTAIEKELERKVNPNERKAPTGLYNFLGTAGGIGALLTGRGPLAAALYGFGRVAEHFNKPDVLIRRGIMNLNPPEAPAFTPPAPYTLPATIQGRTGAAGTAAEPLAPIAAPIRAPEAVSAPGRPIPEGEGLLPRIGGPGREGILGAIGELKKSGVEDLKVGDTFVDEKGEPRRIVDIADGKIETADGTKRTYEGDVGHLGEINSPRAQLARGGKVIPAENEGEFSGKAEDFVKKDYLDPDQQGEMFHVTTAKDKILAEGLKSRKETGNAGLGGGYNNQASNKVSVTFDEGHAQGIADRMKLAIEAAQDKITPEQALDRMISDAQLSDESPEEIGAALHAPQEVLEDWDAFNEWLNEEYPKGDAYRLVQDLDDALPNIYTEVEHPVRIGLTASKAQMAKLNPEQIDVLKVEARKTAKPEHIADEAELRFSPEDLRIAREETPPKGEAAQEGAAGPELDKLVDHINKKDWWHVPPTEGERAYTNRGKFLASSFKDAEFYGRPLDEAQHVQIRNPIVGTEAEIAEKLGIPEQHADMSLEEIKEHDQKWAKAARENGYDAIVTVSPRQLATFRETGHIPRNMEVNDLTSMQEGAAGRALPPQPKLPDTGTFAAIRTDDGAIYPDLEPQKQRTHIMLAQDLGIPPERVMSGGWLRDSDYEGTTRSDAGRWGEQARAKLAVEEKHAAIPRTQANASGESAASLEAQNRARGEKARGIGRVKIDTRSGQEIPLRGVDAVDVKAGPYDEIVMRDKEGNETVLDRGAKARIRGFKKPTTF